MRTRKRRIQQTEIDFLCLAVFGQRSLPDEMAERIAIRRAFYDAVSGPLGGVPDPGSLQPGPVEAVAAVA